MLETIIVVAVQVIVIVAVYFMLKEHFKKFHKHSQENLTELVDESMEKLRKQLTERDEIIRKLISEKLENSEKLMDSKLLNITAQNKNTLELTTSTVGSKLDSMQTTITTALETIRSENRQQLDNIHKNVNEKLEKSLSQQLANSHEQIFTNLQSMTEKITQLNSIGTDITKLNRTLSNVKRRGIFGETQLFSIVEDILPSEQYRKNFRTSQTGAEVVECVVRLPSDDANELYLPIDAKFPQDRYLALLEAREASEQENIVAAEKALRDSILLSAKEICKYLSKNISTTSENIRTTDYGIMFLPTESLYAEVLALNIVNNVQRDYKIYIVGPTNLSALLTVFKTAYQSLAMQQKTKEVEMLLSETKMEFEKFSEALDKVKKNMDTAQSNLDKVIGVRTKSIRRALKNVTSAVNTENTPMLDHFSQLNEFTDV